MLQTDVAYKSSDEFSLELNYAFKQRPASDISTFEFEGNQEERDKAKYGGGPLPYLIVQIKLLKLGDQEVRMRCINNKGEALMNPTKATQGQDGKGREFPMPKDQEMRDQFNKVAGTAFMGDPNGANFAYQAVKAYYAAKAAREGDISGTLNSGRAEEAITAVLGGVTDVNGKGQVLRPWGMDESRFNNEAKAAFDKAIQANGYKGSMLDNWGAYGLQSAGDGKYLLRTGTGYLQGRDGQPVLLDLNGPRSLVDMIPDVYGNVNGLPSPHLPASVVQAPTAKPNTQHQRTR
jgi:hypothetical protein